MGQREAKSNTFFGGVAVLGLGIIIVKIIGALFKIPLGNILGDEGYAHFINAYVVYNVIQMVSTAGLPVALSKTISEANALNRRNQVHRVFRVALVTFLILGAVSCLVMLGFAGPMTRVLGDDLAAHAVMAMAPTCLLVCTLSAFRGYAQGHANMVPTAVSQIIEAAVKLVVGLSLAWYLVNVAKAPSEDTAAGGITGVTIGAAVAVAYLVFDHIRRRRNEIGDLKDVPDSGGDIFKRLIKIAIPITIGASVVPITSLLDTFQVQNILRHTMGMPSAAELKAAGLEDPVSAMYGAYQRAVNFYTLPSSFMVALTANIIPAISACKARKDKLGAGRIAESSLRFGALLAMPAGVGLSVLAGPILQLLARNTDHAIADPALRILGFAAICVCMMNIGNSILQASGFVNLPIVIMAMGAVTQLTVNQFLVSTVGIGGAPVGTLCCFVLIALLELIIIKRVMPVPPRYSRVFIKPAIAAAVMGAGVWAANGLLARMGVGSALRLLLSIGIGVLIYLILVLLLHAVTREDLSLMPKGDKIAKILRL